MLKEMNFKKVYIITGYTDLRKGIDGLTTLVRLRYCLDSLESGTLFLLCGGSCKRIKGLFWDDNGYCMLTKVLSKGTFQWPRNAEEARALTRQEYLMLMSGFSIESRIPGSRIA